MPCLILARSQLCALAAVNLIASTACGGDGGGPSGPGDVVISEIRVTPERDYALAGASLTFNAEVLDEDGAPVARHPTWSSSDPSVIAVEGRLAHFLQAGTAEIRAEYGGVTGAVEVTVEEVDWQVIDAGSASSCGISTAGRAYCWGQNRHGNLGTGSFDHQPIATRVAGDLTFRAIDHGEGRITCGITLTDKLYCWGEGGGLGHGAAPDVAAPQAILPNMAFSQVATGNGHVCALATGGEIWCWGHGVYGQLGRGSTGPNLDPAPVAGGHPFVAVAAGGDVSCGVTAEGSAYCWGANAVGQLGTTEESEVCVPDLFPEPFCRTDPALVALGESVATIGIGRDHVCAVAVSGTLWCWGTNEAGQLGSGTQSEFSAAPVEAAGGATWASVQPGYPAYSGGPSYTCATKLTGSTECWGDNHNNRLGDATPGIRLTPTPISGGHTFSAHRAGLLTGCGVTSDGRGWCWGGGGYVAGTGLPDDVSAAPVEVPGKPVS